jgi:hypothetical protein
VVPEDVAGLLIKSLILDEDERGRVFSVFSPPTFNASVEPWNRDGSVG